MTIVIFYSYGLFSMYRLRHQICIISLENSEIRWEFTDFVQKFFCIWKKTPKPDTEVKLEFENDTQSLTSSLKMIPKVKLVENDT